MDRQGNVLQQLYLAIWHCCLDEGRASGCNNMFVSNFFHRSTYSNFRKAS